MGWNTTVLDAWVRFRYLTLPPRQGYLAACLCRKTCERKSSGLYSAGSINLEISHWGAGSIISRWDIPWHPIWGWRASQRLVRLPVIWFFEFGVPQQHTALRFTSRCPLPILLVPSDALSGFFLFSSVHSSAISTLFIPSATSIVHDRENRAKSFAILERDGDFLKKESEDQQV